MPPFTLPCLSVDVDDGEEKETLPNPDSLDDEGNSNVFALRSDSRRPWSLRRSAIFHVSAFLVEFATLLWTYISPTFRPEPHEVLPNFQQLTILSLIGHIIFFASSAVLDILVLRGKQSRSLFKTRMLLDHLFGVSISVGFLVLVGYLVAVVPFLGDPSHKVTFEKFVVATLEHVVTAVLIWLEVRVSNHRFAHPNLEQGIVLINISLYFAFNFLIFLIQHTWTYPIQAQLASTPGGALLLLLCELITVAGVVWFYRLAFAYNAHLWRLDPMPSLCFGFTQWPPNLRLTARYNTILDDFDKRHAGYQRV